MKVGRTVVSDSAIPRTAAFLAPLSMEFSRRQYLNGLPFPPPGDLSDPGIEPRSPSLQADSLPTEPLEKPRNEIKHSSGALILAAVTKETRVDRLV